MTEVVEPAVADAVVEMLRRDRSLHGAGIEVLSASGGRAVVQMLVGPDAVNGHGRAHGGLLFMLADTAFACAANSLAPPSVTVAADIAFLEGAREGELVVAEAQVRHAGRRQGLYDVTLRVGGRVLAEYHGRSQRLSTEQGAGA